jgi:putative Mg2+ transporter-C (MgtC) family protein
MNFDIEIIIRFLLALLWGGLVGAEREYRGKAAGFRTTIMISFGACFFTVMSIAIGGPSNPDRIAANIVTGIGFLGAGVIFRGDSRVNGITTAATIWAVAAVGMGLGAGYYLAAGCASVLILFVLAALPAAQYQIDQLNQYRIITVKAGRDVNLKERVEADLKTIGIKSKIVKQVVEKQSMSITWQLHARAKKMEAFLNQLADSDYVDRLEV